MWLKVPLIIFGEKKRPMDTPKVRNKRHKIDTRNILIFIYYLYSSMSSKFCYYQYYNLRINKKLHA